MSQKGRIEVEFVGNSTGINQTISGVAKSMTKFGEEIQKSWAPAAMFSGTIGGFMGMFSLDGIKELISGIKETVLGFQDMAEQFDVSTDAVQRWEKALGKSGIRETVFTRSLDALRMKRAEAMEDPAKLQPFQEIGLGAAAMDTGVDADELMQMALRSGASRTQLKKLGINPRLRAAMRFMPGGNPTFSEEDISWVEEWAIRLKTNTTKIKGFFVKAGRAIDEAGYQVFEAGEDILRGKGGAKGVANNALKFARRLAGLLGGRGTSNIAEAQAELAKEDAARKRLAEATKKKERHEESNEAEMDRQLLELSKDAEAQEKIRLEGIDMKEKLRVARRRNMNPRDRIGDIQREIQEVDAQIKYYSEVPEELRSESDRKKLFEFQMRREALESEARSENKPTQIGNNALARVGLFTASGAISSNTDSQKMVRHLQSIDDKIGRINQGWEP